MHKKTFNLFVFIGILLVCTSFINASSPPAGTEQIDTSSYDAFGLLIKNDSDTIIYFFREGSSHVGDKGKIVKQAYTISTATWGARSDVYDDASSELDSRNVGGGIIGNNIFIFFPRYNVTSSTFKDMGYIKSDDLGGSSWSSYTPIDVSPLTLFSPYSHIVKTSDSNTYLQPFYGGNAATEVAQFFKTTDNGNTWSVGPEIYKGTEKYYEVSVAYIGNSKLIALIRDDRWGGGYIKQATSSDDGTTWSGVSDTNLGASYKKKIPYIIYDQETDKVIAIYHDRSYPYQTKISETNALLVHSNPNAWNTPQVIDSGFIMNGYPSIVKTSSNNYFFVYAKEISSSDTDTWGGNYTSNGPAPLVITITSPINNSIITTDSTWLNVITDEEAVCEYGLCKFATWSGGGGGGCSVARNMSITGGITHSQLITGLKNTINDETRTESYSINVNCVDNSGNSNTESVTFYVNLTEENHPPIFSGPIADITWEEDTQYTQLDLNDYFDDIDGDELNYGYETEEADTVGGTHPGVGVRITNGQVTLTPEKDWFGTQKIIFTASDGYETAESNEVTLTVTNVNDAPIIEIYGPSASTILIAEDGSQEFQVYASDVDKTEPSIEWYVNDNFVGSGNSYNYIANGTGTFAIRVNVSDEHETTSLSWTLIASDKPIADKFDGATTDFSSLNESELASLTNVILEKTSYGKIDFSNEVLDLTDVVDLNNNVLISNGLIGSNTATYPQLNKPATLTMKGLSFDTSPVVYYTEGFTSNPEGVTTVCDFCYIQSYSNGVLIFTVDHFTTFKAGSQESKLKISDIEVRVDGEKDSGADENGGDIDKDVYPGSKINIEIELENIFNIDIEDIEIEGVLEDIDDDDIEDSDEISRISAGSKKSAELDFRIPLKAEKGDYELKIEISGRDENGDYHYAGVEFIVEVKKKPSELRLRKALINADLSGSCLGLYTLEIEILNLGKYDETARLQITNPDLNLNVIDEIELSKNKDFEKTYKLDISQDAANGIYPVNIELLYNNEKVSETVDLRIERCAKKKETSETVLVRKTSQNYKPDMTQKTIPPKPIEISFRDTHEYLLLISVIFFILSGIVSFMFIYIALKF